MAQVLWEAAGFIGAHRLHPFLPELLARLRHCGALTVPPTVEPLLRQASPATLKRLLAPARAARAPRGRATTRPGTWLKHQIPLRTFADWDDARPGFLEVDLVAHCGPSTEGFSLHTPCAPSTSRPAGSSWTPSGAGAESGHLEPRLYVV